MRPHWSSYRVRLPLSLSVSAVLTALCLALALGGQTLINLREDQSRNALAHARARAEMLIQALRNVAAGVAHEVNNPLGGMLMAIDTYRCAQSPDARTTRLLDLLERALRQIQESVSALLVEARADPHPLTPRDLDDVRTLAQPRLAKSGVRLIWHNAFEAATTLPAAPVRQLLLNLLLNAIEGARFPDERRRLEAADRQWLLNQPWPGNVRELQHTLGAVR
jgi:signal transduction histidine kinase